MGKPEKLMGKHAKNKKTLSFFMIVILRMCQSRCVQLMIRFRRVSLFEANETSTWITLASRIRQLDLGDVCYNLQLIVSLWILFRRKYPRKPEAVKMIKELLETTKQDKPWSKNLSRNLEKSGKIFKKNHFLFSVL